MASEMNPAATSTDLRFKLIYPGSLPDPDCCLLLAKREWCQIDLRYATLYGLRATFLLNAEAGDAGLPEVPCKGRIYLRMRKRFYAKPRDEVKPNTHPRPEQA